MNGAVLENYVTSEIRKSYLNCGTEPFMYYYRDKDAKEIDIILDNASTPRSNGAVLCMKPELSATDRDNYMVPVWVI